MKRLERLVIVALWCIQGDPSLRPSMKKVTQMLEGVIEVYVTPSPPLYTSSSSSKSSSFFYFSLSSVSMPHLWWMRMGNFVHTTKYLAIPILFFLLEWNGSSATPILVYIMLSESGWLAVGFLHAFIFCTVVCSCNKVHSSIWFVIAVIFVGLNYTCVWVDLDL